MQTKRDQGKACFPLVGKGCILCLKYVRLTRFFPRLCMDAPPLPTHSQRRAMRQVDMTTVAVVHSGSPWLHNKPPCNRQMIHLLEKNESLVTWVQVPPPLPVGTVHTST